VTTPCVFVVDDDQAVRDSLRRLLESTNLPVRTYSSAEDFLADHQRDEPGCLVLDLRMPGLSGVELQAQLTREGLRIPIVLISGHGDIETAVRSIKAGAIDFIRKPYRPELLLERIHEALALDARRREEDAETRELAARVALLTPRERDVLRQLALGRSAKEIARVLGLSRKTVDVHRRNINAKLRADSVIELARIVHICMDDGRLPTPPN
jgi:two-component system, LuxR family, response regulator FixJ